MLPATIFLFLVSYPLTLLLPPASILILGLRLLAISLDAIVQLPITLHLLLSVGERRRLVLLLDRRMQLGLPTLEVHLLLPLDLLLLLLGDCCRRRSSVLLLGRSHGRRMLLVLVLLLLLLGSGCRGCSCDRLLLLVMDLDHGGRMVPDVVMRRRRWRWLLLLLLLLLLLFGDRGSLLVLVRHRHRLLLYG